MTAEKILTTLELCAKGLCEHCEYKNLKEMCKEELNVDIANLIKISIQQSNSFTE